MFVTSRNRKDKIYIYKNFFNFFFPLIKLWKKQKFEAHLGTFDPCEEDWCLRANDRWLKAFRRAQIINRYLMDAAHYNLYISFVYWFYPSLPNFSRCPPFLKSQFLSLFWDFMWKFSIIFCNTPFSPAYVGTPRGSIVIFKYAWRSEHNE